MTSLYKQTKEKSDNELIAEFMGLKREHGYAMPGGGWCIMPVRYETSWDWLMPVVEKISELYEKDAHDIEEFCSVITLPINTPIAEVYNEVVEFIKWFNSTLK